jgi:epoxyqueuosine reductase
MERAWAEKSGLGWIGRHGLLINKTHGSFYFLAELIIDLDCATDGPIKDYCGTCTRCVDACPTDAILPDKTLNASQCISYLTIELKSAIDEQFKDEMNDWIFGCDICQDVCPWNRFSSPNNEPRFSPVEAIEYSKQDWDNLEKEQFERVFKNSAIQRTGFSGLKRNISFLKRNSNNSLG